MNLENTLQTLQEIKAPDALKKRVGVMTKQLPAKQHGFYFPLVAFQTAVVAAILVLIIGVGGGIALAARGSNPGSPFYPLKEAIQKVHLLSPTHVGEVEHLPSPQASTSAITPKQEKEHDDKGGNSATNTSTPSLIQKRQTDGRGQEKVTPSYIPFGGRHRGTIEKFFQNFFHHNSQEDTYSEKENH